MRLKVSKKIIFTDNTNYLLTSYLKDISKYKILDSEEINKLVKEAQEGNINSRDKVARANLRFVVTIAKQFQNRGIPLMDLISAGNEGLLKSIEKYDSSYGTTFLTYSVWWIKQCIYNSIYWHANEIRLPLSQRLNVISITDATNKFLRENGRNPSPEELSQITDIPREQIDYLSQFSNKTVSVDDYIGGDEENSQVCEVIPDGEESLDETINKEYISKELKNILCKLSIREHDIICLLFGFGVQKLDILDICDMYGISRERVRQIKESALGKLRRRYSKQLKELL